MVLNSIFALLTVRKDISKTISILVSANKKVLLKNRILCVLFWIENLVIIMPYVFKIQPWIFFTAIPIDQIEKSNLAANTRVMGVKEST